MSEFKLTNNEVNTIGQALSYGVIYSNDEGETAEFAILKVKIEGEIAKRAELEYRCKTTFCKSCKEPMDKNAIFSTGLCTACFTSNA